MPLCAFKIFEPVPTKQLGKELFCDRKDNSAPLLDPAKKEWYKMRFGVEQAYVIKLAANDICGSRDDDGVARWLERNILRKQ